MRYAFHITFEDGSNPYYHFLTTKAEHEKAIRQWRRNYDLRLDSITTGGGITEWYTATDRRHERG